MHYSFALTLFLTSTSAFVTTASFAAPATTSVPATTSSQSQTPITVESGIVIKPIEGTNATAAFGTLKNTSKNSVTLEVVSAEGFKAAELHQTTMENGVSKMQKIENFTLKSEEALQLKHGGNHIMLFDATKNISENDVIKITFKEGKHKFTLPFKVKSRM